MVEILARLKGDVTMVVIEQFTDRALNLADSVIALGQGAVIFDGAAATVTDEDVVSGMRSAVRHMQVSAETIS
jgi:ABC-type branched-subunit amino acid transport system ATPase component